MILNNTQIEQEEEEDYLLEEVSKTTATLLLNTNIDSNVSR